VCKKLAGSFSFSKNSVYASVAYWAIPIDYLILGVYCNIIVTVILHHPPIKVTIDTEEFRAKIVYRILSIACQQPDSGTFIQL
jgi:hypothetical protein